jgi:hypothetical protein
MLLAWVRGRSDVDMGWREGAQSASLASFNQSEISKNGAEYDRARWKMEGSYCRDSLVLFIGCSTAVVWYAPSLDEAVDVRRGVPLSNVI